MDVVVMFYFIMMQAPTNVLLKFISLYKSLFLLPQSISDKRAFRYFDITV